MTVALVLDAEPLASLARGGPHERTVRAARRGSEDHVDATVVAVCAAAGGGLVLTADLDDLSVLSGANPAITIRALRS